MGKKKHLRRGLLFFESTLTEVLARQSGKGWSNIMSSVCLLTLPLYTKAIGQDSNTDKAIDRFIGRYSGQLEVRSFHITNEEQLFTAWSIPIPCQE